VTARLGVVGEAVSHAPYRGDEGRGVELGPQPSDVDVDGALAGHGRVAPHALQQLAAGEDPARVQAEVEQQVELDPA
jgi:hypothetical protein